MKTFSEIEIRLNIKRLASDKAKTIEGIYYFDEDTKSYLFCSNLRSSVNVMKQGKIKDVHYFKCTKSGNMTTEEV